MRIPDSDRDLLAQCVVDTFRSSGPGGQNVNTRDTAVRIREIPAYRHAALTLHMLLPP